MKKLWTVTEHSFDPKKQHHHETIFTVGNGYLSTRGAFEEGYPGNRRTTFVHGVFDGVPIAVTELANAPDWLPLTVHLGDERFSMETGKVESFERTLDLRTGVLTRSVRWVSASGRAATITFERFASMADEHLLCIRCRVVPEFDGTVEFRAALNGNTENEGLVHWRWIEQGGSRPVYLHNRTRQSGIDLVTAMRVDAGAGRCTGTDFWDAENMPTLTLKMAAESGKPLVVDKFVTVYTSRDTDKPLDAAVKRVAQVVDWPAALEANATAWSREWERVDLVIEGDDEAQLAARFSLFHLLIAAPRHDDRVNIGAKTLSGFGYRGHAFWDTEIFMLPVFTFTSPVIARNLLNYRYYGLAGARAKAKAAGFEGAWFAWESADTGEEVTPPWLPHWSDRTQVCRVVTGEIVIHISTDVAYAAHQYWRLTGDNEWMVEKGAELILDTARFLGSRAEWNAAKGMYEYSRVMGPDEYHDNVDNNAFTNRLAQWNLQTALDTLDWLKTNAPAKFMDLSERLDLSEKRLDRWKDIVWKMSVNVLKSGLIEQFDGYFKLKDVDPAKGNPKALNTLEIFGIPNVGEYQVIKQPDVLMMQYLLRDQYDDASIRVNYDYYTPRTDHAGGSSLGPSIQAIVACMVGQPDDAYKHFILAARADLRDVRGNAGDGIHGASAGGMWQAVVFGFAGLRLTPEGWTVNPRWPKGWRRIAFKFYQRGRQEVVDLRREG